MKPAATTRDWMALAALVVTWGSSFAMTKIAVASVDPAWVMALRLSVAGIFLGVVVMLTKRQWPRDGKLWLWFAGLGFIGHAVPFFLVSWGTQFVSSGLSGVLMGAIPLFVIVLAHIFLPDEKLTHMKAAGFVTGFIGLMIVLGPEKLLRFEGQGMALIGELAILLSCLCYAAHSLLARRIPFQGPVEQAAAVCLTGGAMGVIFAALYAPDGLDRATPLAYLCLLGLGIVPTALATLLVYAIVRRAGVSFVAYSNYLVPVYALGLGAVLLGETLTANVGFGLVLILAGIAASRMQLGKLAGLPLPTLRRKPESTE
ncbi:DMT family transporter [Nordella sp. HKS 07]|uniref:DMT family transporter n=1 Tax=Nordella sp. HKS 07 TaxID=2712222 RepID=UPI0013E1FDD3|nr:DMT family transporter [Nordella sp. HKS 07]QIG46858.1 DMT family transporter [Nordella sp. HKS 07]